jgi:hypothetical protein
MTGNSTSRPPLARGLPDFESPLDLFSYGLDDKLLHRCATRGCESFASPIQLIRKIDYSLHEFRAKLGKPTIS